MAGKGARGVCLDRIQLRCQRPQWGACQSSSRCTHQSRRRGAGGLALALVMGCRGWGKWAPRAQPVENQILSLARTTRGITYLGRFECAAAQTLSLLRLTLLHNHIVVRGTGRNDHGSIGVSTVHTFVKHDVLRIVFSVKDKRGNVALQNCII